MLLEDIIKILDGKIINKTKNTNLVINKIKIDSREILKGDLLIAIKGSNFDGHDFIDEAIKNGACAIIIDKKNMKIKTKIPVILINNTTDSLLKIANYIRMKNIDIPLIAITGSVGKTTTKELLSCVLSKKYKVLKNDGNMNNHIGLPLTLFNLNSEYDVAVLELGMNHLGEVNNLSCCCKPDIGIITNIGTSHIGNLKSKKNIYKAKKEIINGIDDGLLIINGDDKWLNKIKSTKKLEILKCGSQKNNNFKAFNIKSDLKQTAFDILHGDKKHEIVLNIGAKHLINSVLFSIYIGIMFDIDIEDIKSAIYEFKPIYNRMNILELNDNITLIDDCYNSSYESLIGVLEQIKNTDKNKIIILGDILELGKFSTRIHKKIEKYLVKNKEKNVLLVGEEMGKIKNKDFKYFLNNNQLIEYLKNINISNSIILIKGSRRMHLEEIKEFIVKTN